MTVLLLAGVIAWVLLLAWVIALCKAGARADRAVDLHYVRRHQ